jgi:hypothetical protein
MDDREVRLITSSARTGVFATEAEVEEIAYLSTAFLHVPARITDFALAHGLPAEGRYRMLSSGEFIKD